MFWLFITSQVELQIEGKRVHCQGFARLFFTYFLQFAGAYVRIHLLGSHTHARSRRAAFNSQCAASVCSPTFRKEWSGKFAAPLTKLLCHAANNKLKWKQWRLKIQCKRRLNWKSPSLLFCGFFTQPFCVCSIAAPRACTAWTLRKPLTAPRPRTPRSETPGVAPRPKSRKSNNLLWSDRRNPPRKCQHVVIDVRVLK